MIGIVDLDRKNPISEIILSADTIQRPNAQFTPEELDKQLTHIESAAERIKDNEMNLMDIQLIESGRLQSRVGMIELERILNDCVAEFQALAAAKEITIHVVKTEFPVTILTDSNALHEVLNTLRSNALKFSSPHSTVMINVENVENNRVRIGVHDQGSGLANEDKSKLFGKFMRLSARPNGGEDSTGLGLSIVKKLVEAMNETIWRESETGNGAAFFYRV